jgi:hypothetical protein
LNFRIDNLNSALGNVSGREKQQGISQDLYVNSAIEELLSLVKYRHGTRVTIEDASQQAQIDEMFVKADGAIASARDVFERHAPNQLQRFDAVLRRALEPYTVPRQPSAVENTGYAAASAAFSPG